MALSNKDFLIVAEALIKKWAELTLNELKEDINKCEALEILDQAFTRAYWTNKIDELMDLSDRPETYEKKYELFCEKFGEQINLPAHQLKPDIKDRLNKIKSKIVSDYEREITRLINTNKIVSPIEQIFLMEWKYYRIEEKNKVELIPQEPVKTANGNYFIDFLITPEDKTKANFKIAIELDGHDFHEKTKSQVEYDKKRERAIIKSGYTVLRFSGSEIFKNCRSCIEEIENYIKSF